jgi:hypothetical protein
MRLPLIFLAALVTLINSLTVAVAQEQLTLTSTNQPSNEISVVPNAPAPQTPITSTSSPAAPHVSIWHQRWDYETHHISNREVLGSKSYWAFVGADALASSFDAEMSKHQGRCVEGADGLPPHPTRWQLYEHNLPENAAVIAVGFLETKIKMPRWLMFTGDVYPVQAHLRAGLQWYQNCW